MVRLDDNHVVTENRFLDAVKPGAIFDVGVIMSRDLARSQHPCPQCGKEYTVTDTWIKWYVVRETPSRILLQVSTAKHAVLFSAKRSFQCPITTPLLYLSESMLPENIFYAVPG